MRKVIFTATILAFLSGCAGDRGFMGMRGFGGDGGDTGTRDPRTAPRYTGMADPYQYDDKYWPPVAEGQAFPPQHMWAD